MIIERPDADPPADAIVAAGRTPGSVRLTATQHAEGAALVLSVEGDVDHESAEQFREHALRLLNTPASVMIVCLEKVTFLDSQGLAALVAIWRRADCLGVGLRVSGPVGAGPSKVLHLTGLDALFDVFPTLAEALVNGHRERRPMQGNE